MVEVSGGASAPPRLRDRRGRFVEQNDAALLAVFMRESFVQFRDPFHGVGVYTLVELESMKRYPVTLYHSHHPRWGAWHCCTGGFDGYDKLSPYGHQLAISPERHYGWPGDKWEGQWTVKGMASLLIHLALSANLGRLRCGGVVGNRKEARYEEQDEEEYYDEEDEED